LFSLAFSFLFATAGNTAVILVLLSVSCLSQ